jgi:transposase-like protein
MSDHDARRLPTEVKVRIVQRVEAGEQLSAVAAEMGVLRKSIYEWRAAYRSLGACGLNLKTGPKRGGMRKATSARGGASSDAPSAADVAPSSATPRAEASFTEGKSTDELGRAQARIAELERVIGRQQADLHFFREALRLWDAKRPTSGAPISTKSSEK